VLKPVSLLIPTFFYRFANDSTRCLFSVLYAHTTVDEPYPVQARGTTHVCNAITYTEVSYMKTFTFRTFDFLLSQSQFAFKGSLEPASCGKRERSGYYFGHRLVVFAEA
jgi:hypothetical protein